MAEEITKEVLDELNGVEDNDKDDKGTLTPDEKAIQARDGVHLIPYEKLESARTKMHEAMEVAEEAELRVDELADQNKDLQEKLSEFIAVQAKDDESEDDSHTDAFMDKLKDDFPELASGLQSVLDSRAEIHKHEIEELKNEIAPLKEGLESTLKFNEESAMTRHFQEIENAYKNYEDILESVEFDAFKKSLPGYVQTTIDRILEKGTSREVIDLLDDFSKKPKISAKDALAKATEKNPGTISDFPGSGIAPVDNDEAMANLNNTQLFNKFQALGDPAKILEAVSRIV